MVWFNNLSLRSARILAVVAVMLLLAVRWAPEAQAVVTATKTCVALNVTGALMVGDTVECTLEVTASTMEMPAPSAITITTIDANYSFTAASCTSQFGSCTPPAVTSTTLTMQCLTTPCQRLTVRETLNITALTPNAIRQRVTVGNTPPLTVQDPIFRLVAPGSTFYVAPGGNDANDCEARANPCKTMNRAVSVARDGDTILLLAGTYDVAQTVAITKLLTIQPESGAKVVLKAAPGVIIFQVSAQGGPNLRATIRGMTMGGNFRPGASEPVILLVNDNYTEISGNIIGAEDLPINNGILLSNADHPTINNNTIQGTSRFAQTNLLVVGQNLTGFGVVSVECFGTGKGNVSDSVTITNNLFTNTWLAGVWLCSDGGGEHELNNNVFRNNWRALVLKDVTDTRVGANVLTDNRSDGIILYGASLQNRIEGNRIESHVAVDAAGIRVGWAADPILPLSNVIENNQIVRATTAIHVFGARTTVIRGNTIKISGARTAILLTPAAQAFELQSQPRDTEIVGNTIIYTGPCQAVVGCALRLVGVFVPVLATDNDWGLRRQADVEQIIWHQRDDRLLGLVTFTPFRNQIVDPTPTPAAPTAAPSDTPAGALSPPPPPPPAGQTGSPPPLATSTPAVSGSNGNTASAPVVTVPLKAGCNSFAWPGVSGAQVLDAALGITPSEAQREVVIWRQDTTTKNWSGWTPARNAPSDIFPLRRGDTILACLTQPASWAIPNRVGDL